MNRDMILNMLGSAALCLLAACSGASEAVSAPPAPVRVVAVLQGAGGCIASRCTLHFAADTSGDTASFTFSRCSDACPTVRATLTKLAQDRARAIGERLAPLKLKQSYGCPGCVDGPIYVAAVHDFNGWKSSHSFDPMIPTDLPPPLQDASALIDAVSDAVARCESTELVQVEPGCAELMKEGGSTVRP